MLGIQSDGLQQHRQGFTFAAQGAQHGAHAGQGFQIVGGKLGGSLIRRQRIGEVGGVAGGAGGVQFGFQGFVACCLAHIGHDGFPPETFRLHPPGSQARLCQGVKPKRKEDKLSSCILP